MASVAKLTEQDIQARLGKLSGWTVSQGKLHREYKFADFVHAFGFMASAAVQAEAFAHHPEWCNVWNRVTVDLTTHDAGGITEKDFQLAAAMEAIAKKPGGLTGLQALGAGSLPKGTVTIFRASGTVKIIRSFEARKMVTVPRTHRCRDEDGRLFCQTFAKSCR